MENHIRDRKEAARDFYDSLYQVKYRKHTANNI